MFKRAFLLPFAAAVAALSGNVSQAAVDQTQSANLLPSTQGTAALDMAARANPQREGELLMPIGEDLFKFVLKRAESGELIAYHSSHQSHRSHSSHRSHYSSSR